VGKTLATLSLQLFDSLGNLACIANRLLSDAMLLGKPLGGRRLLATFTGSNIRSFALLLRTVVPPPKQQRKRIRVQVPAAQLHRVRPATPLSPKQHLQFGVCLLH
jgi:hypothetical protein